ncbi:MarR family protein [Sporobacter termitidis DSM 10068]|uniref:MarR family protein n=1 Tax=Sporobacter termitidis DSM 10068 TaxID=1123282 RepID=A0A1M5YM15_9FIRM|nr:MarR family transcriptional regulator [Sporobacter termitidis]SHI13052.1 MarR family protein [Sporobacter termitidis DSM 10068]
MNTKPLGMEIHALSNLLRRKIENVRALKYVESVTGPNGWIIGYLAEHGGQDIYQKDLEANFSITRSTASKVIKLMEQKGLVERQGVPHDARLKKLVLTEKALGMHREIVRDLNQIERELIEGFSEEEVGQLYSYIGRMKKNLTRA